MEKAMLKNKLFKYVALILSLSGLFLTGKGTYIHAKAGLAKYLLHSSWQKTIEKGDSVKPWPWADTWPVARMIVPEHEIDLVVLEGDSGNVLAFGPGHMMLSSLPGQPGNAIISGHQDTTFRFLERVKLGDRITIQTREGSMVPYKIVATQIIDEAVLDMNIETDIPLLTLVTCYPFDALVPGGPERYLVFAQYEEDRIAGILKKSTQE
jgi:sortase A